MWPPRVTPGDDADQKEDVQVYRHLACWTPSRLMRRKGNSRLRQSIGSKQVAFSTLGSSQCIFSPSVLGLKGCVTEGQWAETGLCR
jgi:hypothetical protein